MKDDDPKKTSADGETEQSWNEDGERRRWKDEYDTLKSELQNLTPDADVLGEMDALKAAEAPPGVDDRRTEPRYQFDQDKDVSIFAHIGPKAFPILNISVGGLAFYSDTYFEPGSNLLLSALGMVALDVIVADCELEETNPDFMEYNYLVRAKFSPRVNGYLVYVLSREMYIKQMKKEE